MSHSFEEAKKNDPFFGAALDPEKASASQWFFALYSGSPKDQSVGLELSTKISNLGLDVGSNVLRYMSEQIEVNGGMMPLLATTIIDTAEKHPELLAAYLRVTRGK